MASSTFLSVLTEDGLKEFPEEVSRRQLHSKTFCDPDVPGRFVMRANVDGLPRHYMVTGLSARGDWLNVDLSNPDDIRAPYLLTRLANKIGYVYQPRESDSPAITVELLGYPLAAKVLHGDSRAGGQVYYADVDTDLDIYTQPTPYRYGIFKVLKSPDAPRTLRFQVSWSKAPLKATHAGGEIQADALVKAISDGISDLRELHFDRCYMPARRAWDTEGKTVEVKVSIQGNIITEEVVIPEGFAAWPVAVDTDVTYYAGTNDNAGYTDEATYAAAHDAATAPLWGVANADFPVEQQYDEGTYGVQRAFIPFDASGLPDDAIISAATMGLYGRYDYSYYDFDITIVSFAGSNPMIAGDFDQFGTTDLGHLTTAGFSVAGYNVITLNAAGIAAISKTAVTKFGLRSAEDIAASSPAGLEIEIGRASCRERV